MAFFTEDEENIVRGQIQGEEAELSALQGNEEEQEINRQKTIKKDCVYLKVVRQSLVDGNAALSAAVAAFDSAAPAQSPHVLAKGATFPISVGDQADCGGTDIPPDPPPDATVNFHDPKDWQIYATFFGTVGLLQQNLPLPGQTTITVIGSGIDFTTATPPVLAGDIFKIQDPGVLNGTTYPIVSVTGPLQLVVTGLLANDGVNIGSIWSMETAAGLGFQFVVVDSGQTTTDPDIITFQGDPADPDDLGQYFTFHGLRWDPIFGSRRDLDNTIPAAKAALKDQKNRVVPRDDTYKGLLQL